MKGILLSAVAIGLLGLSPVCAKGKQTISVNGTESCNHARKNENTPLATHPFVVGDQCFKVNGLKARDLNPMRVSTLKAAPTKALVSLMILTEVHYRFGVAINALSNKEKHEIIEQRFYEHLQDAKLKGAKRVVRKPFRHTESMNPSEREEFQEQYAGAFKKATSADLKAVMFRLKRSLVGTFLNRPVLQKDQDFMTPEEAKHFTPRLIKKMREAPEGKKEELLTLLLVQHVLEGHDVKKLSPERRAQKARALYASFATRMGYRQGELSGAENAAMVKTVIGNIERLTGLKELYAKRTNPKKSSRKA